MTQTSEQLLDTALRAHDARRWSPDEAALRAQLRKRIRAASAICELGLSAARQGFLEEAVAWFEATVSHAPTDPHAHLELARALRKVNRGNDAAVHFDTAAALRPGAAEFDLPARIHRGIWLDAQGHADAALAALQEAAQRHPTSTDAWLALGRLQLRLSGPEAASASFQCGLRIEPSHPDLVEWFARTLQAQQKFIDASIVFAHLLEIAPDRPLTPGRLLHCKMLAADWTSLEHFTTLVENGIAAGCMVTEPFGPLGYCASPQLLHSAARVFAAAHLPDRSTQLPKARIGQGPKIKLGYVGGEFRLQATAMLLVEVLERHDREHFDVFAFDNGWDDDSELRARIGVAVTEIVPIRSLDDMAAAAAIRDRGIDILINLNGYFGLERNSLFSLRPASIQVNYLGFPGSMGVDYIDYLIADRTVLPEADQVFYTEKIAYLPGCYQPNDSKRPVDRASCTRSSEGLPDGAFVFCCLNNMYKITPAVFAIWMRLLLQVPGSVLWLQTDLAETRENLRFEAQERGVEPARIVIGDHVRPERHLARLGLADLFLDTWPCNAHTTASDALWAGIPILTCTGPTFSSRVAASLLKAVGLPELVTHSFVAYEALAHRLATQPSELAGLRDRLAQNRRTAPLYDSVGYTRHLESLLLMMAARARSGKSPAPLGLLEGS